MTVRSSLVALAFIVGLTWSTVAQQAQAPLRTPDVIFVPTPQEVVDVMLKIAKVTKNDVVYDLGSGDGRIPITASRVYGAKAVGIDIDPTRIREPN
jgi:predicted RNA methylase